MSDKTTRKPVVYCYARVSTAGQVQGGLSLETQKAQVTEYYQKNLAETSDWGGVFVDDEKTKGAKNGVSGKTRLAERPAGSVLVERLRPGDHVVVNDLTRAFRNFRDAIMTVEQWITKGIYFHIVREGITTATAAGRTFIRLMALFAQMEREMIAERTREVFARGREKRKASGKQMGGGCPIGHHWEGNWGHRRVVPNKHEQETMDEIVRMHDELGYDWDQIYFTLFRAKVRTHKNKPWSRTRCWRAYQIRKEEAKARAAAEAPGALSEGGDS